MNLKEVRKNRNLMLLFAASTLVLGILFLQEYNKTPDVNVAGRVPLLILSSGLFIYYTARFFKSK